MTGTGVLIDTELAISREHLHHHARALLDQNPTLIDLLTDCVTGHRDVACTVRKAKRREYLGVTADSLNASLKASFHGTGLWSFEATVRDQVIFDSRDLGARVEGFDFARYDERSNLVRLWNACFGRRALHDGQQLWERVTANRTDYAPLVRDILDSGTPGQDLALDPASPTILGEIQFGNWALAYRDLMKLLAARAQLEVDLFVYVVADGNLADMISSGTVNYDKFTAILHEFGDVVTVPTWVVGIDFAEGQVPTLEAVTAPSG